MDTSKIVEDITKSVEMMGSGLTLFNDGFEKLTDLNFDLETVYQVTGEPVEIPLTEELQKVNDIYDSHSEIAHKRLTDIQNKILDMKFGTGMEAILNSNYQNMKRISEAFDTIINCSNNIEENKKLEEDIDNSNPVDDEAVSMSNIGFNDVYTKLDSMLTVMNHLKETMVIP